MNDPRAFLAHIASRIQSDDDLVLDAGCGPGRFRYLPKGRYVGLDITAEPYGDVPRRVDVAGSVRSLPFHDATFDVVFVVASLHMFGAPVLCLMEFFRVLKPGGRFICFDYTRRTHKRIRDLMYPQNDVTSYNLLDGRSTVDLCRLAGFGTISLGCFLPGIALSLPVPWPIRPLLVPLMEQREGWWLVEAIK